MLSTRSTGVMKRGTEFISHMTRVTLRRGHGHVICGDRENAYGLVNRRKAYHDYIAAFPDWRFHLNQLAQVDYHLMIKANVT